MQLPTLDDVEAAVAATEPATVDDIRGALNQPWERRGTVYNRLKVLVASGAVICAEDVRPATYAINHLTPG